MRERYLIIGLPRSGTTVIHLLLRGHPQAAALNDELEIAPFFTQGLSTFTHGNDLPEERSPGLVALFDALASVTATDATTHIGAKVACPNPALAARLVEAIQAHFPDLKIVLTVREDMVAQYGSWISAKRSGVWHSWYKKQPRRKASPMRVDKWLFIRYVDNSLSTQAVLRRLHQTHAVYESTYERLLAAPEAAYADLFAFLGLDPVPVTWLASKKVMPDPRAYIRNYDAMRALQADLEDQHARQALSPLLRRFTKGWAGLHRVLNVKGLYRSWRTRRTEAARKNLSDAPAARLRDKLTTV